MKCASLLLTGMSQANCGAGVVHRASGSDNVFKKPPDKSNSGHNDDTLCPKCDCFVTCCDAAISCYVCEKWLHCKCAKLTKSQFQLFEDLGDAIEYFCDTCQQRKSSNQNVNQQVSFDIQKAITDFGDQLKNIKKDLSSQKASLEGLSKQLGKSQSTLKSSYSHAVLAQRNSSLQENTNTQQTSEKLTVVISNVTDKSKCSSPSIFLKEISKIFVKLKITNINIRPTGLIFLQLASETEVQRVLENWRSNYFGGNTKVNVLHHHKKDLMKGVLKNVPTDISEAKILNEVKDEYSKCTKVQRFIKNGTLLPVVLLQFNDENQFSKAIDNGVTIDLMHFQLQEYIPRRLPTRCFRCQQFGHIASFCKNKPKCVNCGGDHDSTQCNDGANLQRINCHQDHRASDKKCPKFRDLYNKLNFLAMHQ